MIEPERIRIAAGILLIVAAIIYYAWTRLDKEPK